MIPPGSSRLQLARWVPYFLCDFLVNYISNKSFGKVRSSVQPEEGSWGCADCFKKKKSGLCELVRLSFSLWAAKLSHLSFKFIKQKKKIGYHCIPFRQEALTILSLSTSSFQDHRVYPSRQLKGAMGSLGALFSLRLSSKLYI